MPQIDLNKLTSQELKNLLTNSERLGRSEMTVLVIKEMERRGMATSREYRTLEWNPSRVREAMKPFKEIAASVAGNRRTPFTEAGGLKIGRPKNDPERMWVDTYCAIKTGNINAVFVCYIKQPGDEPEFRMRVNEDPPTIFKAEALPAALTQWQSIAHRADVRE
jgi:hypothetical protein